ncbi:(2Fe-2S)-binding protein [Leptolyngbya sp. 15MV]|nr:(2Fe-2S)-binding protein [Leptolyngbya sp. 15MV]
MDPDDHVCLCFHVSLRKIRTFLKVENPSVPSLISECLSAGTGCRWCVPFLKHLHAQHLRGQEPDLRISPQEYAEQRAGYRLTGIRPDPAGDDQAAEGGSTPDGGEQGGRTSGA